MGSSWADPRKVKDGLENKKNLSCWIDYENAAFLAQAGLFHVCLFLSVYTHVNLYLCIYDTVVEIEMCIYDVEMKIYMGIDIDVYVDIPYMYIVYGHGDRDVYVRRGDGDIHR